MNQKSNKPILLLAMLALASAAFAQETAEKNCRVRVLIVKHSWDGTKFERGVLTQNQSNWWRENAKKFPGVCLVAEKPADFAISWAETWDTVQYTATVPVTTTHSGTVTTDTGRTATYSGTSTTNETRQQEWNHWYVQVRLVKYDSNGQVQEPAIFVAQHHGRWRWSKPDKDAFEKAIKALSMDGKK